MLKKTLFYTFPILITNSFIFAQENRPHSNCYWVEQGRFLAGEYPGTKNNDSTEKKLKLYLNQGINSFIDLTEDHELKPYKDILFTIAQKQNIKIHYTRIPIKDMDIPSYKTMKNIIDTINTELAAGKNVYVHCWGGIGRTGTVIGCYLVSKGLSGEQALTQLADWWKNVEKSKLYPISPQTRAQQNFVLNFNAYLHA